LGVGIEGATGHQKKFPPTFTARPVIGKLWWPAMAGDAGIIERLQQA